MPLHIVNNRETDLHIDAVAMISYDTYPFDVRITRVNEFFVRHGDNFDKTKSSLDTADSDMPESLRDAINLNNKDKHDRIISHFHGGQEEFFHSCYQTVFQKASEKGVASLGMLFPMIPGDGDSAKAELRIAFSEAKTFLSEYDMEIYLIMHNKDGAFLTQDFRSGLEAYLHDHFAPEQPDATFEASCNMAAFHSQMADMAFDEECPMITEAEPISPTVCNAKKKSSIFDRVKKKREQSDNTLYQSSAVDAAEMRFDEEKIEPTNSAKAGDSDRERICELTHERSQERQHERSLEDVVKNLDKTFMEMVFSFADAKGLSDTTVQRRANLDRKAFSKLKCGTTKNPSKSTALAIAIALELDLDNTKDLLSRAGLALSPCSRQDLIVQYFIEKQVYDIYEINLALFEHGEPTLGAAI